MGVERAAAAPVVERAEAAGQLRDLRTDDRCGARARRLSALRRRDPAAKAGCDTAHPGAGDRRLSAVPAGESVAGAEHRALRPRPAEYHPERRARTHYG